MGVRDAIGKIFGAFNPKEAASESGFKHIIRGGFHYEQVSSIPLTEGDVITFSVDGGDEKFPVYTGILPYLDMAENRDNYEKLVAYTRLHDIDRGFQRSLKTAQTTDRYKALEPGIQNSIRVVRSKEMALALILKGATFRTIDNKHIIILEPKVTPFIIDSATRGGGPPEPRDSNIQFGRPQQ